MNSKKWSFSKTLTAGALLLVHAIAGASTTKVGNGDDGRDLEGGTPITSGIIFETRIEAIEALKKLNIQGVAGLGTLIPELEHSEMLMAAADTRPIAMEGDWERSQDGQRVFARTFAEPHAPTRFFPAAQKLTHEQLIALHTHEALHRALPASIREDEDKVSLLTMALTSPSATFDRVNRIAAESLREQPRSRRLWESSNSLTAALAPKTLPAPTKSMAHIAHSTYFSEDRGVTFSAQKLGLQSTPFGVFTVGNQAIEAVLSLDAFLVEVYGEVKMGPLSFTAKLPFRNESQSTYGPYAQFNLRSLETTAYGYPYADRDVFTLGGFFENESDRQSSSFLLTYTAKSASQPADGKSHPIGSTWSAFAHEGFKVRRLSIGGVFEFHHCLGTSRFADPFSILRAGPEIKWSNGSLTVGVSGVLSLNREIATLDDLGDLAGHGAGQSTLSAFISGSL